MTAVENLVVSTGGTGGHIFPALAVASEFKRRAPGVKIVFAGGKKGPEGRLAKQEGLEFYGLPARGVLGGGFRSLGAVFWLTGSFLKSWNMLRRRKPDAVVGFGGYAAFAPVLAAYVRGIPRAIHEQNYLPGFANRMLGGLADKVLLSFPDENRLFDPKKTVVTGNPVRMEIRELGERYVEPPSRLQTRRLLVAGGSQGARALNHAVVRALPGFKERGVEIRHQTGPLDFEEVRSTYADFGMNTESVTPFIEDMAAAYEWADLVLCRAGASTVAELAVAGKASVLVPFPHATHQHQLQNARHLEDAGAARIIVQNLLEDTDLAAMVGAMFGAEGMIRSMSRAARKMARPDAAERLADAVSELVEAKKRKKRRK